MTGNSSAEKDLALLKNKLKSAIDARSLVESDLKKQSSLLSEFIIKLSQAAKGVDISLDNKLAKLRTLFTKSASLIEIESAVKEISLQLNKFAQKNEVDIRTLQQSFDQAGEALQKVNGLPDDLRRQLRETLKENAETKEALSQYVPLLSQLVAFYQAALKKGNVASNTQGLIKPLPMPENNSQTKQHDDKEIIKKFSTFLSKIHISKKYQEQIRTIKSELKDDMPHDKLIKSFLAAFDVISHDLVQERNTAKIFLSTLSETLATVQTAVNTTISTQQTSQKKLHQLNARMQGQINDMSNELDQANSLVDIKSDINIKLQAIAQTLTEKSSFEQSQQEQFSQQLSLMKDKVSQLERQSKIFEQRIQEQQAKSLQDALTKLYNRAAFDEHFAKEIVRSQHNQSSLAIVVADLDDFKRINDTYGHTAGDKTLQVIANTFKKHLDNKAFVARYGGEEFVFVFTGVEKDELVHTLNLLRKTIAKLPFKFKNNRVSMTLSIGVTHIQQDDNVHIAFERADTALYKAKNNGKNQVIYMK